MWQNTFIRTKLQSLCYFLVLCIASFGVLISASPLIRIDLRILYLLWHYHSVPLNELAEFTSFSHVYSCGISAIIHLFFLFQLVNLVISVYKW